MNQIQEKPGLQVDLASAERVLATFGHSERVEALLVERLDGLIEAIPRLRPWRGFSGGAWVIGARTIADEARTTRADYSRIDFEIRIGAEAGRAEVVCRSTIRSRDRRSEQVSLPLDTSGLELLGAWFETMLLSFGQQYFEHSASG
jgi:hypothetical protein